MQVPFVYHPCYSDLDLPPRHRYPIQKYQLLKQWADKHGARAEQYHRPQPLSWQQIGLVHSSDYLTHLRHNSMERKAWRRVGFPWSEQLLTRTRTSAGGTALTVQLALQQGCAIHFSGGYHHAHYDWGSGFCLINDLALAAKLAVQQQPGLRILIIDTDVHQGDGTATLLQDDPQIITCSLHGEKNFPFTKAQSDYDIELPKGTSDEQYLNTLQQVVPTLLQQHRPDLIIYDAGVDIYQKDELGHLSISLNGLFARDKWILSLAKQAQVPCAAVIGGGYQRNLPRLVRAHGQLLRAAYHVGLA